MGRPTPREQAGKHASQLASKQGGSGSTSAAFLLTRCAVPRCTVPLRLRTPACAASMCAPPCPSKWTRSGQSTTAPSSTGRRRRQVRRRAGVGGREGQREQRAAAKQLLSSRAGPHCNQCRGALS